jgi:hypothetical protein
MRSRASYDYIALARELRQQFGNLEKELNQYLAGDYGVDHLKSEDYQKWLSSHKPFHWFIDFNSINKFSAASLSRAARRLRGRGIDPALDQREHRSLWTPIFSIWRPRSKLTGNYRLKRCWRNRRT